MMDHNRIREEDIVERYVLGKLVPEKEAEFEAHYFSCDRCFQEIQATEKIALTMRQAVENQELTFDKLRAGKRFSIFDLLRMPVFSPALAVVSLIIVLILIYPAWRGTFKIAELKKSMENLQKPQANIQSLFLPQVRSGSEGRIPSITLSEDDKLFVLNFTFSKTSVPAPRFRGEIVNASGETIWIYEDLKPLGEYRVFSIACHGEFFEPGEYTLKVIEIDSEKGDIAKELSLDFGVIKE